MNKYENYTLEQLDPSLIEDAIDTKVKEIFEQWLKNE